MANELILASGSKIRAELLRNAGLTFRVQTSNVDEDAYKAAMRQEGMTPKAQAEHLAELKAEKVSLKTEGLVIGADQMMSLNGEGFDKPASRDEAFERLRYFSGKTHYLESAVVVCQKGEAIWRQVNRPKLTMRVLSDDFINIYLDQMGDEAFKSVGAYQLEGLGVQLFTAIEGDYFSILGLPLLPLLNFLRERGDLPK